MIRRHRKKLILKIPSDMDPNITTTEEYPSEGFDTISYFSGEDTGQLKSVTVIQENSKTREDHIFSKYCVSWDLR